MNRYLRIGLPALAALLLAGGTARAEAKPLPSYDEAVRTQAPEIIKKLHASGYKNVGVLKFMARNENGVWRDNLGPINRSLADRLEIALLVALKPEDDLGIIFRASDVVANLGITLFAVPMVLFASIGGRLAQSVGPFRLGTFGLLVGAAAMFAYGHAPSGGVMLAISLVHATNDGFTVSSCGVTERGNGTAGMSSSS